MPRVAYAISGGALPSAFCPVPAYDGRGFGPWDGSPDDPQGQPGTLGVPTGLPDFGAAGQVVNGQSVRGGGAGYSQGSGTMPGVWYPQLYWQQHLSGSTLVSGNTQTPSIYSDNQMPVPARDPVGRAAILARPPVFLSGGDLRQPAGSRGPRWPNWLPSMSYGG
jgi:hypothetical protein